ncbi:MAG: hypothetical protein MJY45_01370 [Bacteroidales bacterium]|nr:hypothetical protein [Bacteroidales bacterium]
MSSDNASNAKGRKLSMRMKLILSLNAVVAVLLISCVISVLQYRNMRNYVSGLIADNIEALNVAQQLVEQTDAYNLGILTVIGDEGLNTLPDFDQNGFSTRCARLRAGLATGSVGPMADSVVAAQYSYMQTSYELNEVLLSDFIDSRAWYFESLQPQYKSLHKHLENLSLAIYNDLRKNSATFDRGFYRSIIPGIVAIGVGMLLVFMLLFFILAYYVNPIYNMLEGLNNYRSYNRKYANEFDGDDQLAELNSGILELTAENQQLRKRILGLKSREQQL